MAVNILDLAKGAMGGGVLDQLGGMLGEDRGKTESALDGILPAILGGMMQTASSPAGAQGLDRMAAEADGGLIDNIGDMLSNNSSMLMTLGAPILAMIFGGKQDGLISTIAKIAGVGGGSAGTLLKVVAPLIVSLLGKKKTELNLNTDQFKTFLMDQKDPVANAMPPEVSNAIGFGDFLSNQGAPEAAMAANTGAGTTTTTTPRPANDQEASGGGFMKMLLPLVIIAGLGYLAYTQFFAGPDPTEVQATQQAMSNIVGPANTVTDELKGITDVASAEAAVPAIETATENLDKVGNWMENAGDAGKEQVTGLIGKTISGIEAALEAAYKIPGVEDVLKPAIGPFLDKLRSIGA